MASPYGRGLVGLWKKGWDQIPAVMGSSILGVSGLILGAYTVYEYQLSGRYDPKYKRDFVIYRSDDPRKDRLTREWF